MNSVYAPVQEKTFVEHLADLLAPRLRERREVAERLANVDALTSLPNRRAFEMAEQTARTEQMSIVLFDLNNFGKVNKFCGHETGDEILKYYAGVLADVARKYKVRAFRFAGDEFVIIAPRKFAAAVRDAVERRAAEHRFQNFEVSISGTIGATFCEADCSLQKRKALKKESSFYAENFKCS